jgi:hypothetical protein
MFEIKVVNVNEIRVFIVYALQTIKCLNKLVSFHLNFLKIVFVCNKPLHNIAKFV